MMFPTALRDCFETDTAFVAACNAHPLAEKQIGAEAARQWRRRDLVPHAWRAVVSAMVADLVPAAPESVAAE